MGAGAVTWRKLLEVFNCMSLQKFAFTCVTKKFTHTCVLSRKLFSTSMPL